MDKNFGWMLIVVGLIAASAAVGYTWVGLAFAIGALVGFIVIHFFTDQKGEIKKWRDLQDDQA